MSGVGTGEFSARTMRSSAILTATDIYTTRERCMGARKAHLFVKLTAASAANEVVIIPLGSPIDLSGTGGTTNVPAQPPAAGDDDWYGLGTDNEAASDAVLDAGITLAAGADYTKAPTWRHITVEPIVIRLKAAVNATDVIRVKLPPINVEGCLWFQCVVADADAAGTLGTAVITATFTS